MATSLGGDRRSPRSRARRLRARRPGRAGATRRSSASRRGRRGRAAPRCSSGSPRGRSRSASPCCSSSIARARCSPRDAATIALALALGLAAGVLAGLFGVGGGILFVPTLLALGLGQLRRRRPRCSRSCRRSRRAPGGSSRYGNLRCRSAAAARARLGRRRRGSASRSRRRCPSTSSGGSSACCCSCVAAQLAWRARRPVPILRGRERPRGDLGAARRRADRLDRRAGRRRTTPRSARLVGSPRADPRLPHVRVHPGRHPARPAARRPRHRPYDGSETWVEQLLREPAHREAVAKEVRAVAAEIAADPAYAEDEALGPGRGRARALPRVRPQAARLERLRPCGCAAAPLRVVDLQRRVVDPEARPASSGSSSRRRPWQSSPAPTSTCAESAGKPEVIVQTCRSWTLTTPGARTIASSTSFASIPRGAASSRIETDVAQHAPRAREHEERDRRRHERVGPLPARS